MNRATVKRFSVGIADIQHRGIQWGVIPDWRRTAHGDLIDQVYRFRLIAFTISSRGSPQPLGRWFNSGVHIMSHRDLWRQIRNYCGRLVEDARASSHRYSVDGLPWEIHAINNYAARTAATQAYIENICPAKTKNADR